MNGLAEIASRQIVWSTTGNYLKNVLDRTRWIVFGLSIAGALLATIAGQSNGDVRWWFAMAGAAALATGTFLTSRLMQATQVGDWVRARAAAEALKREAFKCAAGAAPYNVDEPARLVLVNAEREKIEDGVVDLIAREVEPTEQQKKRSSTPAASITPDDYVKLRVLGQADGFYAPRAERYRQIAAWLGWTEFGLALAATIITAIVGSVEKKPLTSSFDLIALTAVLTTISGAIVAHLEAGRYAFLVTTYRATARRLKNELARTTSPFDAASKEWSDFVDRCEAIIAEENGGWLAKWTRATEPSK